MVNNVTFCIQTFPHDNSGFSLPSPDSAVLLEVIDEHNWLHPEDPIAAMLSSSCADIFQDGEQLIPVGSIEFVESGLRRLPSVLALSIQTPAVMTRQSLMSTAFLKR